MSQLNSEPGQAACSSHFGQNNERRRTPELLESRVYFVYLVFYVRPSEG